ncbi:hypothetical protein Vadar_027028 [Vaccinium darrowii]|uniref:Uncharacterized protein n=1 Tax=Vaccinium darrowii TaxID=229202 RepID=A0ACB7YIH4_9ERIC|nr:hypothetical protein Vadar_027028 [Vaccinium darrowii]
MGERNKSRSLGSLQWNIDTSVRSKSANCKVLKFCTKIEGPKHLFTIWKEIEDNVVDCPEGFRPVVMRACKKLWRNHKGLTKKLFYAKHKDDPNILLKVPKRVLPDQWVELVNYWGTKAAKTKAKERLRAKEVAQRMG